MTKNIKLSNGGNAIVDSEDFEYLNQWKWSLRWNGYACRRKQKDYKVEYIYMHRVINNTPALLFTDHINRNKLDNRRINLRTADKRLNGINRDKNSNNTSGHKGVIWHKKLNKWGAQIKSNYKNHHLGVFENIKDAIKARQEAERVYHV